MKQRSLSSVLCFVLIFLCVSSVSAEECMNRGNFIPNSTYDSNLRGLLSSLPSNVSSQDGLYYYGSIGQEPNRVYATGMCIPGSEENDCFDCIKTASDETLKNCPNQTEAYRWPGDPTLCLVRYSNSSFSGTAVLDPPSLLHNTGDINSNLTEFTKKWDTLVGRMINAASTGKGTPSSSSNYYKADITALTTFQDIYAVMHCTPDLSSGDCANCLKTSAADFQSCCDGKQGGVVSRPSCFFRWDLYPFSKAFDDIKLAPPPVSVPQPAGDRANRTDNGDDGKGISPGIALAITVPITVAVLIVLVLGFFLCRRRKSYQRTEIETDSDISAQQSLQYDFKTIEAATNKFSSSNKLGQGGFGEVYKGKFSNGTEVAVKRLSKKSGQGAREFKNEAVLVAKLQHRNLVRLLGFCVEGEEKILVYEFLPNKSLNYFLFDNSKEHDGQLDWKTRYKIIEGIARGVLYLHQDSRLTIIHRDLKASNILLDADMNPKVADFGLARIMGMDQTQSDTSLIVGTYGYMAPEYAMHGHFSMKSDVYSFGVIVLEIISGKRNNSFCQPDGNADSLVAYAWELWRNGSPLELVDPTIEETYQHNEVIRCIHIALLCVQKDHADRPGMTTVILMLSSNTMTLPVPREPGFFFKNESDQDRSLTYSVDDASITQLEPR